MLKVTVTKGNIEKALKQLKTKVKYSKQVKQLMDGKTYTKPSQVKREQMAKAKYIEAKYRDDE